MNSALYFPHTRVNSQSLLVEALLLWDRFETIVPWEDHWIAADLPLRTFAHKSFSWYPEFPQRWNNVAHTTPWSSSLRRDYRSGCWTRPSTL
jgi:hypothetical protein